jgi:hypothetical protein
LPETSVDSRTLSKIFQLVQNNNTKLENVLKKQDDLEMMIDAQDIKINEVLSKLEKTNKYEIVEGKGKEKGKGKKIKDEFYQVNMYFSSLFFCLWCLFSITNYLCITGCGSKISI